MLNYSNQPERRQILDVVNHFRGEYTSFFAGGDLTANVTQMLWHRLHLCRRRIEELGLSMRVHLLPRTGKPHIYYSRDGRYVSAHVEESTRANRTFLSGNKMIGSHKDNQEAHYTVIESQRESTAYICPNCGAQATQEQLLGGCFFCGTKFQLEDFFQKVSAFTLRPRKKVFGGALFWVLLILSFIIQTLHLLYIGLRMALTDARIAGQTTVPYNSDGALGNWMLWCVFLFVLIMIVMLVKGIPTGFGNHRLNPNRNRFANRMRVTDPQFSVDAFESGLENKLSAVHFADRYGEVSAFIRTNMDAVLPRYRQVVYVDLRYLKYKKYDFDGQHHRIIAEVQLNLLEASGKRLMRNKETLMVELKKALSQHTQEVCETKAYQCDRCGAPISLMEGICHFCGGEMNLILYDWVITRYDVKNLH